MKTVRVVSAVLLALPFLVFGGNYFLHFFPMPPGDGSSGDQLLQAMRNGGLMAPVAFSHVVVAGFLLFPRTRFAGGLLQLPMSLGMVAFHATMLPAGLVTAIPLLLFNVGVLADWPRLCALFERNPAGT
jgi:hypothetical protein